MNPVYCPNCRCAVRPADILCPSCGAHQHLPNVQNAAMPPRNPFCCASCGNEAVQKVSALVHSGTWNAQATGTFGGASHVADSQGGHVVPFAGTTQSSTAGASHLARVLAPPAQPALEANPWATAVMFFWTLCVFVCLFNVFTISDTAQTTVDLRHTFILVGLGCGIVGLALFLPALQARTRNREGLDAETADWQKRMDKWNQLYYCPRCDSAYNGQTGQFAPAQEVQRLL